MTLRYHRKCDRANFPVRWSKTMPSRTASQMSQIAMRNLVEATRSQEGKPMAWRRTVFGELGDTELVGDEDVPDSFADIGEVNGADAVRDAVGAAGSGLRRALGSAHSRPLVDALGDRRHRRKPNPPEDLTDTTFERQAPTAEPAGRSRAAMVSECPPQTGSHLRRRSRLRSSPAPWHWSA